MLLHFTGNVVYPLLDDITEQFCDIELFNRVTAPDYFDNIPKPCDNLTDSIVAQRCSELHSTIYGLFRTMNGECNNQLDPRLGTPMSRLSRLLPAQHDRFNIPSYVQKPSKNGEKLLWFTVALLVTKRIVLLSAIFCNNCTLPTFKCSTKLYFLLQIFLTTWYKVRIITFYILDVHN